MPELLLGVGGYLHFQTSLFITTKVTLDSNMLISQLCWITIPHSEVWEKELQISKSFRSQQNKQRKGENQYGMQSIVDRYLNQNPHI